MHEGTSLQRRQRQRSQELNDKSNLIDLTKECHNELTSGEIVSLKNIESNKEVHHVDDPKRRETSQHPNVDHIGVGTSCEEQQEAAKELERAYEERGKELCFLTAL
ncbi:hypothetical protein Tco_0445762 [Tanacetum coccineum]